VTISAKATQITAAVGKPQIASRTTVVLWNMLKVAIGRAKTSSSRQTPPVSSNP